MIPRTQLRERPVSHALTEPRTTFLGQLFASYAELHSGKSGFAIVASGQEAFMARYAFTALAEKTVDVQYYIWEQDVTGRLLLSALIKAADRGVRVRILLDDLRTAGRDHNLAVLATHPNIQVQLYNPFAERWFRVWDVLFNFARITHRMHNKAFIVDNAVAIVGGRNIGDNYFLVHEQANYRDLDLFVGGPIVREVSASFDAFWNSSWAVPVRTVVPGRPTADQVHKFAAKLDHAIAASEKHLPFRLELNLERLIALAKDVPPRLIWGEATVLADKPDKPQTAEPGVLPELWHKLGETVQHELLLEIAYFVPGKRGVESLCNLTARGVHVRILTNSFASNDVILAHVGYANYRDKLLRCGVELYELQPLAEFIAKEWTWLRGKSEAGLHTKAGVIDRRVVFIGSFNLDPRSVYLNTELAIMVESSELADKVAHFMETGMQPGNAYRVERGRNGKLVWVATAQDKTVILSQEPRLSYWHRMVSNFLSWLPIEGQL